MFVALAKASEMLEKDSITSREYGIPTELLMENAGREAFLVLEQEYESVVGKTVFIFIGAGNNGGDGIVLSRYLKNAGAYPVVICQKPLEKCSNASLWHARIAKKCGVHFCSAEDFYDAIAYSTVPDIIIDALLGIGFEGKIQFSIQERITYINRFVGKSFILAIDIPSGLHCTTGMPTPVAVRASATVTFDTGKIGLYMPSAEKFTGTVFVRTIGMPIIDSCNSYQLLANAPEKPIIKQDLYKNSAGHILVIGGSEEYTGAPQFAGRAALKMGAGLVTIATLSSIANVLRCTAHECIISSLEFSRWGTDVFEALRGTLQNYSAIIVGPGMGSESGVVDFISAMLHCQERPATIFDADALRAVSLLNSTVLSLLREEDILTPHVGELARMLCTSPEAIQNNRLDIAELCCARTKATLIIKGAGTLIVNSKEPITLAPFAVPNLAVAGSGDILTGLIAGEIVRQKTPFLATCSAVYYHAKIGEYLQEEFPLRGNTPDDIINAIVPVLHGIHSV